MSILSRITNFFRGETPPTLRNKPGGLAWIDAGRHIDVIGPLHGRFVTTVALDADGFWRIEPPQQFKADKAFTCHGKEVYPGDSPSVHSLVDAMLVPVPEIGDDVKDESATYLPRVPAKRDFPLGATA